MKTNENCLNVNSATELQYLLDKQFNKHLSYATNDYEFTVNASDNKAKYECQVRNAMTTQPKKANIRIP